MEQGNVAQMLRVPGSKVRYFMHSQYLGFVYCGIPLVLAVFPDSVLRILPYSQYFGGSILWNTAVLD